MPTYLYTKSYIEEHLEGYWYREPKVTWAAERVAISRNECQLESGKRVLFIAIDEETWSNGSQNKGIYAGWNDTHKTVINFQELVAGVIAQQPIQDLDESIPQFIVENSYDVILTLAQSVFTDNTGKIVAITGTAGKSTTKNMLHALLSEEHRVVSTRGNHNTRTGVPLTIACAVENPDYLIVEAAISGLWMGKRGILEKFPPHIGLITSIDGGQQLAPRETALCKARIATSMKPGSLLVMNRDMVEYETIYNEIKEKGLTIITYGKQDTYDSYIVAINEGKGETVVKASILGETVTFTISLIGTGMVYNTVAVLTIAKLLGQDIHKMIPNLTVFQTGESVLQFEEALVKDHGTCTILDDSWNATGLAMIETINVFSRQSKHFAGKKIAILGRIENLGKDAKRQHELLAQPIIDSSIDLVFAHGPEMKYMLQHLPETRIGGYFENARELAQHVARIVTHDDFLLIKGSPRSSDFKHVKKHLIQSLKRAVKPAIQSVNYHQPFATGSGALTVRLSDDKIVGQAANIDAMQNQGLGNALLLHHVLKLIFDRKLEVGKTYEPTRVEINENKAPNALQLRPKEKISLNDLLFTSIVNSSPNALLLIANQVLPSNRETMKILRQYRDQLTLNKDAVHNITGRRISNKQQLITLDDLLKVGKLLFARQSSSLSYLRTSQYFFDGKLYDAKTNLFDYGHISHGLFFGYRDSMAITLSHVGKETYITAVIGAPNAYKRDVLLKKSLESALQPKQIAHSNQPFSHAFNVLGKEPFNINILGDTYFGEFYTDLRKRRGRDPDAITTHGREYSFTGIQPFFSQGDYNIVNFEAVLSDGNNNSLRARKQYTLYADPDKTIPALKDQGVHAVTLANNHLMDFGNIHLKNTLKAFEEEQITSIGAGINIAEAERHLVLHVKGKRVSIFNGYWYGHQMYRDYDAYAFEDKSGVASLSGNIIENIRQEREHYPDCIIIVVAHWGADFQRVRLKQRQYAKALSEAGTNLIIGHGAHMMQEIERFDETLIVYSIGNGVFNSDGEYNQRAAPPYGFLAQVSIGEKVHLRLYPMYTNNLKTYWRPRFVNTTEVEYINVLLQSYNNQLDYDWDKDDERHFLEFDI